MKLLLRPTWRDGATWALRGIVAVGFACAGFAMIERFRLGGAPWRLLLFWLIYAPLVYWVCIREIRIGGAAVVRAARPRAAVQVSFALRPEGGEFGGAAEREAIHVLSDRLAAQLEASGQGEFDGDEFGAGRCTLFMYGEDAEAIYRSVAATLAAAPLLKGARVELYQAGAGGDKRPEPLRVLSL
ncbi:hypothetical protein G8A07_10935 [Roseateles sp. DAIF2]|uniref:hypothetical protein n=1 Tax=Roseateles sp. DAIF2 TaxID=2714952 RepID=UPI0018A2AFD0|nr:hypothetical protein [Roseateles sp. DAIF2]QPF73380.1 hypothetical protein G8A07_10935 [Roseateles sp. DAIF2]